MSYGHAHGLNAPRPSEGQRGAAGDAPAPPVDPPGPMSDARPAAPPIDPALYQREDVRRILAERDIGSLFRVLKDDAGLTQRTIAELVGMAQSEVSEILDGRRVLSYEVLVRIAQGLGVPRECMGLGYGAYGGDVTVVDLPKGVDEEMLRRHLIELGAGIAVGAPLARLGELLGDLGEVGDPPPVPLPLALGHIHVVKVRNLTRRLDEAALTSGSDPEVSTAAAAWADRLLGVPGTEPVKRALMVAVTQLHLQAGWSGFDSGLYDRAMRHYGRALTLATQAGDSYCQALALNYAGLATVEHGRPNDGLKMLQCGAVTAECIPSDRDPAAVVIGERSRSVVQACAEADSATAYARLECPEHADAALSQARELWTPTPTDPGGDLDRPAACLELDRGRLDAAEPFAVASVRRWEGGNQVDRTQSAIVLGTIHVRAGEQRGLQLAHSAIDAADKLTSVRARRRLLPLAAALDSRSGSDAKQLARMARKVAATRA